MTNFNFQTTSDIGQQYLTQLAPVSNEIKQWKSFLGKYQYCEDNHDDICIWLTCILALKAVNAGNFGVGSILIDPEGAIVSQGHNEVFNPYFRSDRHAEMVVMDHFEDTRPEQTKLNGYTLYTSLEPCPMCLVRLSTTSLGKVLHGALDITGGMISRINDLPPFWLDMTHNKSFLQAECSQALKETAINIFLMNLENLLTEINTKSHP